MEIDKQAGSTERPGRRRLPERGDERARRPDIPSRISGLRPIREMGRASTADVEMPESEAAWPAAPSRGASVLETPRHRDGSESSRRAWALEGIANP